RAARVFEVELQRFSVPRGAVNDRLAVRREPGRADRPAAERDLLVGRGSRFRDALVKESAGPERREESGRADCHPEKSPAFPRHLRPGRPNRISRRGGLREGRKVLPDALDVAGEVPRGGVTLFRVFLEASLEDPTERRRDGRVQRGRRFRLFANDRGQRLGGGPSLESALARRELVENRAQGELVRAKVRGLLARLLR